MQRARLFGSLGVLALAGIGSYWALREGPPALDAADARGSKTSSPGAGKSAPSSAQDVPRAQGAKERSAAELVMAPDPLEGDDLTMAALQAHDVAEHAVEIGDLGTLRALRTKLEARPDDTLLSPKDERALDLAIACLAQAPEARKDARLFFRNEPDTALHMHVRRVCLGVQ